MRLSASLGLAEGLSLSINTSPASLHPLIHPSIHPSGGISSQGGDKDPKVGVAWTGKGVGTGEGIPGGWAGNARACQSSSASVPQFPYLQNGVFAPRMLHPLRSASHLPFLGDPLAGQPAEPDSPGGSAAAQRLAPSAPAPPPAPPPAPASPAQPSPASPGAPRSACVHTGRPLRSQTCFEALGANGGP